MPLALHFRFNLVILDLSIFGQVPRHFRLDLAIFAPIANHFILDLSNFCGRSLSFFPRPFEFLPVACPSSVDLAIFVPVALNFYLDLAMLSQ